MDRFAVIGRSWPRHGEYHPNARTLYHHYNVWQKARQRPLAGKGAEQGVLHPTGEAGPLAAGAGPHGAVNLFAMPPLDRPYYSMVRMHTALAVAALALLAATLGMFSADARRPWKTYQRQYRALRGLSPQPPAVAEISLAQLASDDGNPTRIDRCTTCHQGIEEGAPEGLPQPHARHPRLDLFVGRNSPHPAARFGCTVCHEGQGGATDFRFSSHLPNDSAQQARWAAELGWSADADWDHPMLPRRYDQSRCLRCHRSPLELEPSRRFPDPPAEKLLAGYQLVRQLGCWACHQVPAIGEATCKPGPSLRDIAGKCGAEYLAARIRNPTDFLPDTRMPRLYGLYDHLSGSILSETRQAEEAEIAAVVEYLRVGGMEGRSGTSLSAAKGVAASSRVPLLVPNSDTRSYGSYGSYISSAHVPLLVPSSDLAAVGRGRRLFETQGCLACHRHRDFPKAQSTQGPDLSNAGQKYLPGSGAAWLADWIRNPAGDWPQTLMPTPRLEPLFSGADGAGGKAPDPAADLAAYLLSCPAKAASRCFTVRQDAPSTKTGTDRITFARRAIAKRGCASCHDIPGLETAEPIGPSLADWGRTPESLLAFERIDEYVAQGRRVRETHQNSADTRCVPRTLPAAIADGFYEEALRAHRREGFAWQKLRAPRSFDYGVAAQKPVGEQLRMGQFSLTEAQREAIVAFLLAQSAEMPSARYVCQPNRARRAIIEGRKVIDKYACAECHTLEPERWTVDGRVALRGMPRLDLAGNLQQEEDDNGTATYFLTLWEPAKLDGRVWPVGGPDVPLAARRLTATQPSWGGGLARLLYPRVLADARQAGASGAEVEAWGWLPPPLVAEGAKAEPQWLFRFLLDPMPIRPAAVLRMPRFNLSRDEAAKLADYFAAAAGFTSPYTPSPLAEDEPIDWAGLDGAMRLVRDRTMFCGKCHLLDSDDVGQAGNLPQAGQVGNLPHAARNRTLLAPRLDRVAGRLRPEYLRRWLANPKSVLPYTAMPALFPSTGPPLGQDLFRPAAASNSTPWSSCCCDTRNI